MCSIFGYIATSKQALPVGILERMARANIRRGPHAFGFAWVSRNGRLHHFKQEGSIVHHLDTLSMIGDAVAVIGHVRYATHGHPSENINNHPHPCDAGWLVHNGVVHNYEELLTEQSLLPVSQCDSEAIALLIEKADGSHLRRAATAVGMTTGNCAIAGIWSHPLRLILARSGNPLHLGTRSDGKFFSSVVEGLPPIARVTSFTDNTAAEYNLADNLKGVLNVRVYKIARDEDRDLSGNTGAVRDSGKSRARPASETAAGEYRGG